MHEGMRPRPPVMREAAPIQSDSPKRERPNRVPFGSMALKLSYEMRPGFHRHWINDFPGRIDRALAAGYEHVKGKDGKNVNRIVGVAEGGGALTAFLMEIPEEWYQEDQKKEQDQVDAKEETMRRGQLDSPDKGYVPSQGIKITSGN